MENLKQFSHFLMIPIVLGLLSYFALQKAWCSEELSQEAINRTGKEYLKQAAALYDQKKYFESARYAFSSFEKNSSLKPNAYAWVTLGLIHSGLPQAASYFFIRTLQSGNHEAIQSILRYTQDLILKVGADLFRKYLTHYTKLEDYDTDNRNAFLYSLGKDALLNDQFAQAIQYLSSIQKNSPIWPFSLQLRATAYALEGKTAQAVEDFRSCISYSKQIVEIQFGTQDEKDQLENESEDLRNRCLAGEARTLYEIEKFDDADRIYDQVSKRSLVWPDILFEQGWNSFSKKDHNKVLGKLVTYKSPALKFIFNSEIEVLRAQSYLSLCLYSDANEVVNEFNSKYTATGIEIKDFVEKNSENLGAFYELGKRALLSSRSTSNNLYWVVNQFIRGPYFRSLSTQESRVIRELQWIQKYAKNNNVNENLIHGQSLEGFPGFLQNVLHWRVESIQLLGGAFVKNSLIDYHSKLINDFEKMAFIKLEMLKIAKDSLVRKIHHSETTGQYTERFRGQTIPSRRDDQYRWIFNGEFWADELGDYVFGLESECTS